MFSNFFRGDWLSHYRQIVNLFLNIFISSFARLLVFWVIFNKRRFVLRIDKVEGSFAPRIILSPAEEKNKSIIIRCAHTSQHLRQHINL